MAIAARKAHCREHDHEDHDGGGDERAAPDVGHIVGVEEAEVARQGRGIDVDVLRAEEQQRVACLQHHLSGSFVDALATSGHSCQHQVVFPLKRSAADGLAYQFAAEVDVGRAELAAHVQLTHRKDMMVGTHQLVLFSHLDQLVDLSGIHQMVASHDGLVFRDGRQDIIEVIQLYQATAVDVVETGLTQCLADVRVV